jgi:hypothetical protein
VYLIILDKYFRLHTYVCTWYKKAVKIYIFKLVHTKLLSVNFGRNGFMKSTPEVGEPSSQETWRWLRGLEEGHRRWHDWTGSRRSWSSEIFTFPLYCLKLILY